MNKLGVFGCALDSDERELSIKRKIKYISENRGKNFSTPYDAMSELIGLLGLDFEKKGAIEVETWLKPFPNLSDLIFMTVPNFVSFIDSGGCREYSEKVYQFTKKEVFPHTPFLIGVDHSLTGGVLKALSEKYGRDNLGFVVIDSHFDGISLPIRCDMILYADEVSNSTTDIKSDHYLWSRKDSYNTESFIKFLIKDGVILPENVICAGVSNYPSEKTFGIEDSRVKKYLEEFKGAENLGLTIIKKEDIRKNLDILAQTFDKLDLKKVYVSIDMDIGANASYEGVRFADGYIGMTPGEILKISSDIKSFFADRSAIAGLDMMEIDMYTANELTYTLGLKIIDRIFHDSL